jgi:hypothetical protein
MSTATHIGLSTSFAVFPLISSSLTVFNALVQPGIFIPFLRATDTDLKATNRALRLWFNYHTPYGLSTVFAVILPTIFAGSYALTKLQYGTRQWNLYAAGTAFALGHFAFAPLIVPSIQHITDEAVERTNGNVEWLKKWLGIHFWRTILTDVPALICFSSLVLLGE